MAVARKTTASRRKPIAVKDTKVVSIQSGDEGVSSAKIQKINSKHFLAFTIPKPPCSQSILY